MPDDWKMAPQEEIILQGLHLVPSMVSLASWKAIPDIGDTIRIFKPPLEGFIKLSFDGASKGNSGQAGVGGIFRDQYGITRFIYDDSCGFASHNEA